MRDVDCDECGEPFAPEPVEEPTGDGGAVQFFSCPNCGVRYDVARFTAEGLKARRALRAAVRRGDRDSIPKLKARLAEHTAGLASGR